MAELVLGIGLGIAATLLVQHYGGLRNTMTRLRQEWRAVTREEEDDDGTP